MPDADADNFLPPLTPYGIMKLGKVKLLPFFLPGDPAMGEAVRGLSGKRSAVMLANQGAEVELGIALDSGSHDHVCDLVDCPGYSLEASPASQRGGCFIVSNAAQLPNRG